jgi:hypothetical protein
MPFKNIDNPWLVKTLFGMLTVYGVIAGTALAPLSVVMFNPSVQKTVDTYAQLDPTPWYKYGAICGGAFGFLIALGILVQLSRQAAQEDRFKATGEPTAESH